MMLDQRLLHGMQPAFIAAQPFDRDQFLAIERRQKLYARIDCHEFYALVAAIDLDNDNSTRAAIAFGAALFRTGHAHVFAQELQHRARRVDDLGLYDLTIENESDGRSRHWN
jgi:hypothetical protein